MAEPIVDVQGGGGQRRRPKPAIIPPEREGLRIGLSIAGSVLTAIIGYYVMLPALNLKAMEFYYYLALVGGSFIAFMFLLSGASAKPEYGPYVRKKTMPVVIALLVVALFFGVAWVISSPFFQAKKYASLIGIDNNASFTEDIAEPNFSEIPKIDEAGAKVLANRAMGDLADDVSQFTMSETTTQINYKGKPVRVVTLNYASIIKWLTNTSQGLPGYIIVDMANEEQDMVLLENRIRYSDAEHFGKKITRHLRFQYPTYMFGIPTFEIDDEGNPYWIAPRIDKTIGLLGGEDVISIVLVDAVTGECSEHSLEAVREDTQLQWIDRIYAASLLDVQFNYAGKYIGGFWNSFLGQKNVWQTTTGTDFTYLSKDGDVYLYTGVSSVTGDKSIIGFILVNQRTKEAKHYNVKGASESSAQEAAQGLVQAQGYTATAPLLINFSGQPTYFLSLKDASGVRQGYSLINVAYFSTVKVWAASLEECTGQYVTALQKNGVNATAPEVPEEPDVTPDDGGNGDEINTVTGVISDIRTAVVNGNTNYYIALEDPEVYYSITAGESSLAVLLAKGDTVTITFKAAGGAFVKASAVARP